MNLITKLTQKLKNSKKKMLKTMATIGMAGIVGLTASGLTGCFGSSSNSESQSQQQSQQGQTINYSKYSQTLQNVLKGEYYVNLINTLRNNSTVTYEQTYYNPNIMNNFECHPYGFLESKGYNVSKIKSGELYCYSDAYIDGNDLYIECKVEKEASTNYLGNYLIKYTLTNKEKSELDKLYKSLDVNTLRTYAQAPLFIQEISYTHTPTVISEAFSTKESILKVDRDLSNKSFSGLTNSVSTTFFGRSKFMDYDLDYFANYWFYAHQKIQTKSTKINAKIYKIKFTILGNLNSTLNGQDCYTNTSYNIANEMGQIGIDNSENSSVKFYNNHGACYADIIEYEKNISNVLD